MKDKIRESYDNGEAGIGEQHRRRGSYRFEYPAEQRRFSMRVHVAPGRPEAVARSGPPQNRA